MLKGCSNGLDSRVLVVDQDRLSRSIKDLQVLKEVFQYNNVKLMLQNTVLDLNNKDDDFMSDIQGIFSKRELKVIAERSARVRYQKAKQGKFPSGGNDIPYGHELDEEDRLVINQEEARVIRLIFDLAANQGWSCYKVPERLNAMGIPTRFKKLGRVLKSNKYGRVYENIWTRNNIKSIVTKELYYKDEYIYAKNSKFDFVKPVTVFYYGDLGKKKEVTGTPCSSAAVRKELIEEIIKNDIKYFLLNPDIRILISC